MKKNNWLNLTDMKVAALVCILFLGLLFTTSRDETKRQNENFTWQMENLKDGNSFVVLTRDYPSVFKNLEKQFRNSSQLVNGEKKVKFGVMEYNWLAHTTCEKSHLKEVCIDKDDHLTHYKIEITDTHWERPGKKPYVLKSMKITRY